MIAGGNALAGMDRQRAMIPTSRPTYRSCPSGASRVSAPQPPDDAARHSALERRLEQIADRLETLGARIARLEQVVAATPAPAEASLVEPLGADELQRAGETQRAGELPGVEEPLAAIILDESLEPGPAAIAAAAVAASAPKPPSATAADSSTAAGTPVGSTASTAAAGSARGASVPPRRTGSVAPMRPSSSMLERPSPSPGEIESLIGTKGLTWAGALVLLVALGFLVHWAWTTFQTPPWLQVLGLHLLGAGIVAAGLIVARRGLPIAGDALTGLGVFVLYAVAFAAERLYQLWPPQVALGEFTLLTVLAIVLALVADSMAVIIIGALGGYLAPVLFGGQGDHVGLFLYLASLNAALVGSAIWKSWHVLKPLALVPTVIMFALWIDSPTATVDHRWSTLWLAALHAALFLVGTTLPTLWWRRASHPADWFTMPASSVWFLSVAWLLFHEAPGQQLALLTWGLAALHGGLFWLLLERVTHADRLPRLHLAMAAVFFVLAVPLQLDDAQFLGPTWCVQGLIFTLIGIYFLDAQMCLTAVAVFALAAARMFGVEFDRPPAPLGSWGIDRRFLLIGAGALTGMAAGSLYWLLPGGRRVDPAWFRHLLTTPAAHPPAARPPLAHASHVHASLAHAPTAHAAATHTPVGSAGSAGLVVGQSDTPALGRVIGGGLLAFWNVGLLLALTRQWDDRWLTLVFTIDVTVIWSLGFAWNLVAVRWYALALALLAVGGSAVSNGGRLDDSTPYMLLTNSRFAELALVAALYFSFGWRYRGRRLAAARRASPEVATSAATSQRTEGALPLVDAEHGVDLILGVVANAVLVAALSLEIHSWYEHVAWPVSSRIDPRMAQLATYSIVWAIYAAVLVTLGFLLRYPLFRILGLAAFVPILAKVFLVDLASLELLPRVLAFAVLGVVLLGVSVLYQKWAPRMVER